MATLRIGYWDGKNFTEPLFIDWEEQPHSDSIVTIRDETIEVEKDDLFILVLENGAWEGPLHDDTKILGENSDVLVFSQSEISVEALTSDDIKVWISNALNSESQFFIQLSEDE